ncbi:MAG: nucleotidyl transferase AbiEii/AbiGii toxin family protein [Patescibacteria group bacterium]|nr:nucleotidyl transferase AbiEii/AbiGii toxin family protein [Patescibacteria group bacterium]
MVFQEPYLLKNFYLSGGTALSSWYLHHRESYDLDFFSEKFEVNVKHIDKILQKNKTKIGFDKIIYTEQLGFNFYELRYLNNEILKVDFSFYPSERVEKGMVWQGLKIDSLYDITLNKFQTIAGSPRAKDYIDLFFISNKTDLDLEKIRSDAGIKFGIHADNIHLARQFLRVVEFKDYPKMLLPFEPKKMEKFFLKLAKSLETEIFK